MPKINTSTNSNGSINSNASGNASNRIAARRRARRELLAKHCVKKTISPERKHLYAKAFLVWLLFTVAGSFSIPDQFVPMFSHCVGFGFFLTITTHRIRWLGVIAIVGIIITAVFNGTLPEEWILIATNSAGFIVLGVMVVLVSLWKVVPDDLKEEILLARDGMINRGSAYFEELRARYTSSDVSVDDTSPEDKRALALLAGVKREHYCRIVVQLDAKLVELEKEMELLQLSSKETVKRLNEKLASETGDRLRAEKLLHKKNDEIEKLTKRLEDLQKSSSPQKLSKMQIKLKKERERAGNLSEIQDKLKHDLEIEKGTRELIEREYKKSENDRLRLQNLLNSKQRNGRLSEQNVKEIQKTLQNEVKLRTDAVRNYQKIQIEMNNLKQENKSLKKDAKAQKELDKEKYENLLEETNKQLLESEHYQGKNINNLNSDELERLHHKVENVALIIAKRRVHVLHQEQQRLIERNEELQDKMLCRVCLLEERSILLVPCGHICLCKRCSIRLTDCPLCRKRIEERREVFVC